MKLKCPICAHEFPPQDECKCPKCGKFINIPPKLRPSYKANEQKAGARKKSGERARSYAEPATNPLHALTQNGKLVFLMFLVFGIFMFLQSRNIKNTVPDGPIKPRVDGRPLLAMQDLERIRTSLELYKVSCYRYPSEKEGLRALVEDPGTITWDGPYLTTMRPDPWGELYRYYLNDDEVELYSLGPDKKEGTADDIHAPPPRPIEEWPDHWLREDERRRLGLPPLEDKEPTAEKIEDASEKEEAAEQSEDQSAAPEESPEGLNRQSDSE
jgi:type II secretion system protein G